MTDEEIIAVVSAHKEGKTIEVASKGRSNWEISKSPYWNFDFCDYRIKPEPHYRPFESAEEVMEAIKEHGEWIARRLGEKRYHHIRIITNTTLWLGNTEFTLREIYNGYTFSDGTPFGKLVEE